MIFKSLFLFTLISAYGFYGEMLHYQSLNDTVIQHVNDLAEDNQSQLYLSHQERNSLYSAGWCVFPVIALILFYPEIRQCKRFCG